ncbi:MAG: deoxyribodipyrimidine photolyase [Acidimicrobiia bacterium]|nr:deoxyribodipyrimidine photolyase [Acidimicrobiia bacterium]
MPVPSVRIRALNALPARPDGAYVLYWMVGSRRLRSNVALQHAVEQARAWRKPLVILEALRCDYPWACDRLHRFVIDGMADHATALAGSPVSYLPYVEPARGAGKGLLASLAADACLVITDDFPSFFIPRMIEAAGRSIGARLEAVDANGILPMRATDKVFLTAFSFRSYLQGAFRDSLAAWPDTIDFSGLPAATLPVGLADRWPSTPTDVLRAPEALIASLPIDHSVAPAEVRGGTVAAEAALARFVRDRLPHYVDDHSHPDAEVTSGLSPYLHFGHIGPHEVFAAVMTAEGWTSRKLGTGKRGQREGWWGASNNAEAFLDQLITWRELGYNMCAWRPDDYAHFDSLPAWARATLDRHAVDERPYTYTRQQFMHADTHDPVWNAAQRQLAATGTCHNYMRMVWGKKILEWSPSADEALDTMIDVMNRYALDGRNPNSYTGYCWTLGRYDRPWAPEREIFGTIRYMSSANTVRKLRMKHYLARWK